MTEIWRPVVGYEGQYQVSSSGDLIKEWKNARIASETLGISHANIIVACRGYYTKNNRKYPAKSAYGVCFRDMQIDKI